MTSAPFNQSGNTAVCEPQQDIAAPRWLERMKALYQEDHQTKFLDLQAEAECLLEQLQVLKQQRIADQDHVE
jgi:hypothetical protein